jgi:hypothetical protein
MGRLGKNMAVLSRVWPTGPWPSQLSASGSKTEWTETEFSASGSKAEWSNAANGPRGPRAAQCQQPGHGDYRLEVADLYSE